MAIWSGKSNMSKQTQARNNGMIGGLSVDAQADRRQSSTNGMTPDDLTIGDYMTGMPNIRLTTLFTGLMKQMLWVLPLTLLGSFGIYHLTKNMQPSYHGEGSLLVQIGPEYIYTPIGAANTNSGGISLTPDTIALNEVGIMKNPEIIQQVIGIMSSPTNDEESPRYNLTAQQAQDLFDKSAYDRIRKAEEFGSKRDIEDAYANLYKKVSSAYNVAPRPKASLIDVAFKHENPDIAVETINQFIDAYISYRQTVFVEGSEDTISERRDETEKQLKTNEAMIARFLQRNNISDFTSEQTGLQKRAEDMKAALNMLRAQIVETETSLATVEDQLRGTPQTINLYVDDRASQRIAQAELELKQLLAKYLPTSNPVRQKRTELEELKRLQSANNGRAAGGRRVGPNPNFQALMTRRNTLQSSADSLREKEVTLQMQLNSAVDKVRRLTQLSPEYQNLLRQRTTLSSALDTYNAKVQEVRVNLAQAEANNENIKVISYANFAVKGRNIAKLLWAGGTLAWGLTLLMIALLTVFLNPENYRAPGTKTRRSRRSRATDNPALSEADSIPESVAPYAPQKKTSKTAATRPEGEHVPELYDPAASQGQVSYTAPAPASAAQAAFISVPNAVGTEGDRLDMQNNPYLNMQQSAELYGKSAQADALPILGQFSATKS